MKLRAKCFSACITVLLVFAPLSNVYAASVNPSNPVSNVTAAILSSGSSSNAYSVDLFRKLMAGAPFSSATGATAASVSSLYAAASYPPAYSGSFIDSANHLHVLAMNASTLAQYKKIINDKSVEYDTAKFSLNTLYNIQNALYTLMLQNRSIECTAIDEQNNRVDITLISAKAATTTNTLTILHYLSSKIPHFSALSIQIKLVNTHTIVSTSGYTYTNSSTNALAGSSTSNKVGVFTLGFAAYNNTTKKYGVVTCGHAGGTTLYNAIVAS